VKESDKKNDAQSPQTNRSLGTKLMKPYCCGLNDKKILDNLVSGLMLKVFGKSFFVRHF
jgi:hypothetical protein